MIFAQLLDGSLNDYQVNLSLNLMEACCANENVPVLIARILLNNLAIKI